MRTCAYIYIYIYICLCVHKYIHIHVQMYVYHMCIYIYIYVERERERDIYVYIYIYTHIHAYMLALLGGAECLYELLVVFGPQLLLDMWLQRSIGCSRGCGMSFCNHACESLLAWIWCGFVRRGLVRRGFLLGVDLC